MSRWRRSGSRTEPSRRWSTACCLPASSAGSGSTPPAERSRSTTCTGIGTRTGRSSRCRARRRRRASAGIPASVTAPMRCQTARAGRFGRCLGDQRRHRRTEQPRRPDHPPGRRPARRTSPPDHPGQHPRHGRVRHRGVRLRAARHNDQPGRAGAEPPVLRRPHGRDGGRRDHRADDLTASAPLSIDPAGLD